MDRPTDSPEWASDTNYPAGAEPEAGTPTKVSPSSGLRDTGWRPSQYPPAQVFNYLLWLIWQWIEYLKQFTQTRTLFPEPFKVTNWALDGDVDVGDPTDTFSWLSSGAGDLWICLSDKMADGQTLKDLRLWIRGDDAADITATVYAQDFSGGGSIDDYTVTINNVGSGTVSFLDINDINEVAHQVTSRLWLKVSASAAGLRLYAWIPEFA